MRNSCLVRIALAAILSFGLAACGGNEDGGGGHDDGSGSRDTGREVTDTRMDSDDSETGDVIAEVGEGPGSDIGGPDSHDTVTPDGEDITDVVEDTGGTEDDTGETGRDADDAGGDTGETPQDAVGGDQDTNVTLRDAIDSSDTGGMPRDGRGDTGSNGDTMMAGDAGDECMNNADCPGSNRVCNTRLDPNRCEPANPGGAVEFVRLTDVTRSATGSCNSSVSDPGPDLFGVELRGPNDNTLGWGNLANSDLTGGTNNTYRNAAGVLDGQKPTLGPNRCPPNFDPNTIVALGCGGRLTVAFEDSMGNRIELKNGQTIVVYEYGAQCGSAGSSQIVRVDACDPGTTLSDVLSNNATCNTTFGRGGGQTAVSVSGL